MDNKIVLGMIITGCIFIIVAGLMIAYGYIHKDGNQIQQAHLYFGFAVLALGIAIVTVPFMDLPGDITSTAIIVGIIVLLVLYDIITNIRRKRYGRKAYTR